MQSISQGLAFPLPNSHFQHSFRSDTFNTITLLHAMRRILKALNFSLNACSYLMIIQVKNEALQHLLCSKKLHLPLIKLSLRSIIVLLADLSFIKSFSQYYQKRREK